jgi:two-component system, cell cycle sensor histidine kinase and response regulator CckA
MHALKLLVMMSTEPQANRRILVIDDNASIHEDFRKILAGATAVQADLEAAEAALFGVSEEPTRVSGFQIDSAFQGREGLELLRQALRASRPYALAFVDIRMPPGWDGIETIKWLWQEDPQLQVVICTAYSDYSWEEIRRVLGETDSLVILKKPFDNVEVLQLAHTLTKKWLLTEQACQRLNELDRVVNERTHKLQETNRLLQLEVREREAVEQALRLSEARFSKAFQASPIPLAIQCLADRRYLDANDRFLAMTGYSREELLHGSPASLKLYAQPALFNEWLDDLAHTKSIRNRECQLLNKEGQKRQAVVSLEFLELGAQGHALVLTQDITERLNLENQLRHAQKMEAVGQLAAGVAHDFNNILTVIQGHASLLLAREPQNRQISDSLHQVAQAAERAASLTRQLLTFSRKQLIQARPVDINEVMRDLKQMLARLIGEHVSLHWELAEEPLWVHGDVNCLEQVVVNLVVNARDAMLEGGDLYLRTWQVRLGADAAQHNPEARPGMFVCTSVTDTGRGMPPSVLRRIFEPFFTTKDLGKGTGLGLATVYGILKQHEGWIEVRSQLDQGSTFTFYLPSHHSQAPSARPAVASSPLTASHETVLVVEDEPPVAALVCTALSRAGYKVLRANNGVEALEVWDKHAGRVDLLLSDMTMPEGISGSELADRLLAKDRRLKVILSSGYSVDGKDQARLRQPGIRFLPKPYTISDLDRVVREALTADVGHSAGTARNASAQPAPAPGSFKGAP